MYFMPIIVAVAILLAYPSPLLALAAGAACWGFLAYSGRRLNSGDRRMAAGELAFRALSVKILALNGEVDDRTFDVHGLATPDEPENSYMRGLLRDAAAKTHNNWETMARAVYRSYRSDPETIENRLDSLLVQVTTQPDGVTEETQKAVMGICRIWGVGPKKTRELMRRNGVEPSAELLAWK